MAKITIEELSDSLKDLLNNSGSEDLSEYQKINDNNLATTDKTIVGAINELFQNANNGKELIADAIGEPLNAEDTFSAMSTDINGLLSTFKANMMNNGVTVESGDKFKQLIDKIATMSSGGGLNIISARELPNTGIENQICVITENPVNNFIVSSVDEDLTDTSGNSILTKLSNDSAAATLTVVDNNMSIRYNILEFSQYGSVLASYIYQDSQWKEFTINILYILKDMRYLTNGITFASVTSSSNYYYPTLVSGKGLSFGYKESGTSYCATTTMSKIDFTSYKRLICVIQNQHNSKYDEFSIFTDNSLGCYSDSSLPSSATNVKTITLNYYENSSNPPYDVYEFDISSWSGEYYLGVCGKCSNWLSYIYLSDIYLY